MVYIQLVTMCEQGNVPNHLLWLEMGYVQTSLSQ